MTLQLLKLQTLAFTRPAGDGYLDDSGEWVESSSSTTFDAKGTLQPISNKDKSAIQNEAGVRVKDARYFYTKTEDIRPIDDDADEPDTAEVEGRTFEVWANSPWYGPLVTTHRVITLIRKDEVADV